MVKTAILCYSSGRAQDPGSGKGKVGKRSEPPHCLKQVVVVVGAENPVSPNERSGGGGRRRTSSLLETREIVMVVEGAKLPQRAEVVELTRYTQDFLDVSSLLKRVRCWRCGGLRASPLLETNSGGGGMSRMLLLETSEAVGKLPRCSKRVVDT